MAADALSFSRKEAGSSAGHAAGDRATGVARTRSGPRWVCPTLPPTAVPDGATLTIPLHVRTVNPQIRLVYRLSVPRRSALNRRALWYSAAFVVLAALVDITDFDRLNAFAVHHLQPLAGGNGHPQMREWTEVLISPAGPMITALVIAAAAICLLVQGRNRAAAAWPAALALALVVEIVSKLVVGQHRSGIWHGFGLTFDSSFPSGHVLRAILITGAVAAVIPVLRVALGLWCAAVARLPADQRLAPAHRHRRRHPGGDGAVLLRPGLQPHAEDCCFAFCFFCFVVSRNSGASAGSLRHLR